MSNQLIINILVFLSGGKLSCTSRMRPLEYLCGMLILLDCRPLQYAGYRSDNERSLFILSTAALLSREQGVEWLCLVDHTYKPGDLPGFSNDLQTILGSYTLLSRRAFPGWTGWKMWYDGQVPRWAKKFRADLVMTTGGISAAAIRIPQCVWMPEDVNIQERKEEKRAGGRTAAKESSFYSARLAESLFHANAIFCFSAKDKEFLSGQTSGSVDNKIIVLSPVADEAITPLSTEEKEKAKAAYAGGKEYFLAPVPEAGAGQKAGTGQKEATAAKDIINLLKAFSLFKKRQMSNMQLILVDGSGGAPGRELAEKLATYKFRQEVHWISDPSKEDQARMTAAAYGILLPFGNHSLGTALLNAWKAQVPVITGSAGRLPEIAGEAALYGSAETPILLAGQLMLLYKDEALRHRLIEKGKERLRSLSGERPVDAVWRGIRMANQIII